MDTDEIHVHPIQQWVDALFADARRVRLVEENRVVLVLEESDIPALHGLLRFCGESYHCACRGGGEFALEVLRASTAAQKLVYHHGAIVGPSFTWAIDQLPMLQWLANRGFDGPLRQYEEAQHEIQQRERRYQAWVDAAPACVEIPYTWLEFSRNSWSWGALDREPPPDPDRAHLLALLESAYPAMDERVRVLLSWFSVGSPWRIGVPGNELEVGYLLSHFGTDAVWHALEQGPVTDAVLAGAARYWTALPDHKQALATVPDPLWDAMHAATRRIAFPQDVHLLEASMAMARELRRRDRDPRPVRSPDGKVTVGITSNADTFRGLVVSGGKIYSVESHCIVRLDEGSTIPVPLHAAEAHVVFAVDRDVVYFAQWGHGEGKSFVARLDPPCGAAPVVLARAREPWEVIVVAGVVYWIEAQGVVRAPVTGDVPLLLAERKRKRELLMHELQSNGHFLFWAERIFRTSLQLVRMPLGGGGRTALATLAPDAWLGDGTPKTALCGGLLLWVDAPGRRVCAIPIHGGEISIVAQLVSPPRAMAAGDCCLYVVVGEQPEHPFGQSAAVSEDTWHHIERITLPDGHVTRLVSFMRKPHATPCIAVDERGVYWTHDDRIDILPLGLRRLSEACVL